MKSLLIFSLLLAGCTIQMPIPQSNTPASKASSKSAAEANASNTADQAASQSSQHDQRAGQGSITFICMQQNQGGAREASCVTPSKDVPGIAKEVLK